MMCWDVVPCFDCVKYDGVPFAVEVFHCMWAVAVEQDPLGGWVDDLAAVRAWIDLVDFSGAVHGWKVL